MTGKTSYADAADDGFGFYKVTFRENGTGRLLRRSFDSEYFCRQFVEKLKRSRKCTLLSYPIFSA